MPPRALLCLRKDNEGILSEQEREKIGSTLESFACTYFDTTLETRIEIDQRERVLQETLDLFLRSDLVVTDRYHGLIFSVLCKKPTIVLPTVDHKLRSAAAWFADVKFVRFAQSVEDVPICARQLEGIQDWETPDWNSLYFQFLPGKLGLQCDPKETYTAA